MSASVPMGRFRTDYWQYCIVVRTAAAEVWLRFAYDRSGNDQRVSLSSAVN